MTVDYFVYLNPHLKKNDPVYSLTHDGLKKWNPELYNHIKDNTDSVSGEVSQEVAIKSIIGALPTGLRVQFDKTFREATIVKDDKVISSGRGTGPESALYYAYLGYLRRVVQ